MKKVRFTILEEDSTIYPHTCHHPLIYMGTVTVEWAMQLLLCAFCSTLQKEQQNGN
jgi:hypothetical protein